MARATLTLKNGTKVEIEGTAEEVHRLLSLSSGVAASGAPRKSSVKRAAATSSSADQEDVDLASIINTIKTCDESDFIEERILDGTSQLNRALLPLFIVAKYFDNGFGLTTGQISRVTADLGVRISTPNVGKTLTNSGARYVLGDQVRKKGTPVRYRLSRRGVQYVESLLSSNADHA